MYLQTIHWIAELRGSCVNTGCAYMFSVVLIHTLASQSIYTILTRILNKICFKTNDTYL